MKRAGRMITKDALRPPVDNHPASFPHPASATVRVAFANCAFSGHRSILCTVLHDGFVKPSRYGIGIILAGRSQETHQ